MPRVFKGRLFGYICDDCLEPLSNVRVRIYHPDTANGAFAILTGAEVQAKEPSLLGEGATNDAGEFEAELSADYEGGPFAVDIYCETVPHRKPAPKTPPPLQFTAGTVHPDWQRPGGAEAVWSACITKQSWSLVRARFHAWVVCGRVTAGDAPAPQVKVSAFDVDWLQDDALGTDVTDGSGHFRIDYATADFKKDVLGLNIELSGGPDLYFRVETLSGTVLLKEPSSRGRRPDRENIGNCFCTEIRLDEVPEVTCA